MIREGQTVEEYEDALDQYEDDWWRKCDFKNQKELADVLGVSQAAITRYVNKLQEKGLIRVVGVKGSNFPLAERGAERYVRVSVWEALTERMRDLDWWNNSILYIWMWLFATPFGLAILFTKLGFEQISDFLQEIGAIAFFYGLLLAGVIRALLYMVQRVYRSLRRAKSATEMPKSG